MMSIPGTEEQKATLLDCTGCHTLERIVRSTHDADEWTQVITRMKGYAFVSTPSSLNGCLTRRAPASLRTTARWPNTSRPLT